MIYLDADIAVVGDIAALWSVDLGDNLIGAVTDEQVDADAFAGAVVAAGRAALFQRRRAAGGPGPRPRRRRVLGGRRLCRQA